MTRPSTVDLHLHTQASDGSMTAQELMQAAAEAGLRTVAVTDHDTVAGLEAAATAARSHGIELVAGVELSVSWQRRTLHIVGLDIDPDADALREGLERLQAQRRERARAIAIKLEKLGDTGAVRWVEATPDNRQLTRSHFAMRLVEAGVCPDAKRAFKRYLAPGKSAYVATQWPTMEEAIGWITAAGGTAVVAHPLKYPMTRSWRHRMLAAFRDSGGSAMEVCSGNSDAEAIRTGIDDAESFGLRASLGSDFHGSSQPWIKLGRLPALPENLRPVLDRMR
ncbi:PHP domain-containing protein [Sinimarinibacterium sp. CAU 1509]|uniref:PHP domain-containing protein n=1 Tax=Sinimarinibacterium sp. CAU 1509 TaxID=2562283 RepID=UPI00146E7475|nr:PHP domain-containing protein [Sinimarinibacterium sp. CAU 1509]